jgi:hypothetical protein
MNYQLDNRVVNGVKMSSLNSQRKSFSEAKPILTQFKTTDDWVQ